MSKQSMNAPLASNEPSQLSWANARAVIKAEMEARDPDYESEYDSDGWNVPEKVKYDCKWCKDGDDTTAPCIHNAARQEEQDQHAIAYAAALAAERAAFEANPYSKGYGPFKEEMIVAHAHCNLKFPARSDEWYAELEKHEVIHKYRAWSWSKMHGSISKGW